MDAETATAGSQHGDCEYLSIYQPWLLIGGAVAGTAQRGLAPKIANEAATIRFWLFHIEQRLARHFQSAASMLAKAL